MTHICGLLAQSQQPGSDQSQVGAITTCSWSEGPACTPGNHLIICKADTDLRPIEGCTISTSQRRPFSSTSNGLMSRCHHECCSHGCLLRPVPYPKVKQSQHHSLSSSGMMASKSCSMLPLLPLQIIDALKQCSQVSDFNNYLAFILAQGTGTDTLVEVSSSSLLSQATLCWRCCTGICPPQNAQRQPASLEAAACTALMRVSRLGRPGPAAAFCIATG